MVKDNPAVSELGVVAYAGVPIRLPGGEVLGSFCSIDTKPRQWSETDIGTLRDLSKVATELVLSHGRFLDEAAANDKIIEGRNRLKQILDSTGEGIFGIDARGVCTFVNEKCVELLGFDGQKELLGQTMHSLIHHSYADGSEYAVGDSKMFAAIDSEVGIYVDNEIYWRKDGTPIPVEYRSYPVTDGGETRAVITFVDISERQRQQERLQEALDSAVQANRQKTRFLANMSHEIRTPMNAILGFGELLDETVQEPKARGYIKAIRDSGESLLNLINDILDLSKIESGKLDLRPGPISVRGMVESVRLLFDQQALELNLDFSVEIAEDCPDFLVLDDLRVRQLIINLVSNSMKFTPSGEVILRVLAVKDPLDAHHVTLMIEVEDSGVGISEEDQKMIFQAFRQGEGSDPLSGTGLGLSICNRLAELMNGTIKVRSELGSGSTFWIELPGVEVASGAAENEAGGDSRVDFNQLKASKILVVDDNHFNRELALGYLEGSHHEVEEANDGQQGIDKVREWRPDLVLMDIRMPVMDGKQAREQIKADPELKTIPVVAVTASSLLHHSRELRRDFDGYMRKPFSRAQLFHALAKILPSLEEAVVEEVIEAKEAGDFDSSKWGDLIEKMRQWDTRVVEPLMKSMVIGEVVEFAKRLESEAQVAGCEPVENFAHQLAVQAGLFEVSKIESSLGGYKALIEELEAAIR